MTCALVTPTSGNSTFSRLDTDSVRPSISTLCLAAFTVRSRGALRSSLVPRCDAHAPVRSRHSRLPHHVVGLQVLPHPAPRRVPQPVVGGPDRVGHLAHQVRLHPPRVAGDLA